MYGKVNIIIHAVPDTAMIDFIHAVPDTAMIDFLLFNVTRIGYLFYSPFYNFSLMYM